MPTNFFDIITEGVSVPLTKLASGYKPTGLIADQVFPVVTSITKGGKIPVFGKDAFKIFETLRARGAKSNRAQLGIDSWLTFACEEHDLAIPLDSRELNELRNLPGDMKLKALFNIQDRTRRRVQWNLKLEAEKGVADYVSTVANYSADHVVALTGGSCWSEAGSDPVKAIELGRETIRKKTGVYPNTAIMGTETASVLKFHAAYTAVMNANKDKVVREDLIADVHNLKKILVGQSMTVDSDGNFVDLWADDFILCYIPDTVTPDIDEPSFGYQIRPGFSPTPYPYVDIFTEEGGKIVNVRCTDMYDQILIMKDCGYILKNCKK